MDNYTPEKVVFHWFITELKLPICILISSMIESIQISNEIIISRIEDNYRKQGIRTYPSSTVMLAHPGVISLTRHLDGCTPAWLHSCHCWWVFCPCLRSRHLFCHFHQNSRPEHTSVLRCRQSHLCLLFCCRHNEQRSRLIIPSL